MIPGSFDYVRPSTLDEAVSALRSAGDEGKVVAGGQSLLPLLRLRLALPEVLVDVGELTELAGVRDEGSSLLVGAMVSHYGVLRDPLIREHAPLVAAATAGQSGSNPFAGKTEPAAALAVMEEYLPAQLGENWCALGVQFTSFELLQTFALLTVAFGTELEVALLGLSSISMPPDEPEPTDYWLASLPETTPLPELVRLAKIRWRIEHDYRELKTGLGLDHFEGRSWRGLHHHALLCQLAFAFLQHLRLGGKKRPHPARARTAARAEPARDPAPHRGGAHPHPPLLPALPAALPPSPSAMNVAG